MKRNSKMLSDSFLFKPGVFTALFVFCTIAGAGVGGFMLWAIYRVVMHVTS